MSEPIGWSSARMNHHFKAVLPTFNDSGAHVNLYKNISRRLYPDGPKEAVTGEQQQQSIEAARQILHRQRVAIRLYSGSRLTLPSGSPREIGTRLHRSVAERHLFRQDTEPSSARFRIYRNNTELSMPFSALSRQSTTMSQRFPSIDNLPRLNVRNAPTPPPATPPSRCLADDMNIVDRFSSHDPEKLPDSKGHKLRLPTPIVYKKKYTEDEIQGIVRRLSEYDRSRFPADSRGSAPAVVTAVPRQTMTRVKKCSAEEVHEIVQRLCKYDENKWPPESQRHP